MIVVSQWKLKLHVQIGREILLRSLEAFRIYDCLAMA